jgi:hypothetical protein
MVHTPPSHHTLPQTGATAGMQERLLPHVKALGVDPDKVLAARAALLAALAPAASRDETERALATATAAVAALGQPCAALHAQLQHALGTLQAASALSSSRSLADVYLAASAFTLPPPQPSGVRPAELLTLCAALVSSEAGEAVKATAAASLVLEMARLAQQGLLQAPAGGAEAAQLDEPAQAGEVEEAAGQGAGPHGTGTEGGLGGSHGAGSPAGAEGAPAGSQGAGLPGAKGGPTGSQGAQGGSSGSQRAGLPATKGDLSCTQGAGSPGTHGAGAGTASGGGSNGGAGTGAGTDTGAGAASGGGASGAASGSGDPAGGPGAAIGAGGTAGAGSASSGAGSGGGGPSAGSGAGGPAGAGPAVLGAGTSAGGPVGAGSAGRGAGSGADGPAGAGSGAPGASSGVGNAPAAGEGAAAAVGGAGGDAEHSGRTGPATAAAATPGEDAEMEDAEEDARADDEGWGDEGWGDEGMEEAGEGAVPAVEVDMPGHSGEPGGPAGLHVSPAEQAALVQRAEAVTRSLQDRIAATAAQLANCVDAVGGGSGAGAGAGGAFAGGLAALQVGSAFTRSASMPPPTCPLFLAHNHPRSCAAVAPPSSIPARSRPITLRVPPCAIFTPCPTPHAPLPSPFAPRVTRSSLRPPFPPPSARAAVSTLLPSVPCAVSPRAPFYSALRDTLIPPLLALSTLTLQPLLQDWLASFATFARVVQQSANVLDASPSAAATAELVLQQGAELLGLARAFQLMAGECLAPAVEQAIGDDVADLKRALASISPAMLGPEYRCGWPGAAGRVGLTVGRGAEGRCGCEWEGAMGCG